MRPEADNPPVVVLVGCQIPGNLGAVARAMGNFGARELRLVGGCDPAHPEAVARARELAPLLAAARRYPDLESALEGVHHAFAASHRRGKGRAAAPLTPAQMAAAARRLPANERWALVLGNETSGLSNAEVRHCDQVVAIPSRPDHPSLNLSHAAAVLLYAWAAEPPAPRPAAAEPMATAAERHRLYRHAVEAFLRAGYLDPLNPDRTLRHLYRLLYRARVTPFEVTLLRGFLRKLGHLADRAGRPSAEELMARYRERQAARRRRGA